MVASVTVREAEFSPADVDAMLETRALERQPRGSHGLLLADAMNPESQFKIRVKGPRMDWAAKKIHEAQELYRKENPKADMTGMRWSAELA